VSVSALTAARYARTPEDAADIVLNAVCKLRERIAPKDTLS